MKVNEVTAQAILKNVEKCITELETANEVYHSKGYCNIDYNRLDYDGFGYNKKWYFCMDAVCAELSIFDWWKEHLSLSQLKDMRKFLKEAIKLGYTGYVCFKVGTKRCANGMWAYKALSTDGYSPKGAALYKSFTPDYNYWSVCDDNEKWYKGDELTTIKALENYLAEQEA